MSLDDQISLGTRRSFIKNTAGLATALLSARMATAQTSSTVAIPGGPANMISDMTFEDVRKLLDLSPNATCGYVRVTFVSKHKIAAGGMQVPFARKAGWIGALLHADARGAGEAPPHPQRSALSLLSWRSDRSADVAGKRVCRTSHRRSGSAQGPSRAALYAGQHIPHRARDRRAAVVSWRLDRMARRRACRRCRDPELPGAGAAIRRAFAGSALLQ